MTDLATRLHQFDYANRKRGSHIADGLNRMEDLVAHVVGPELAARDADAQRLDWLAANAVAGIDWTHPSGEGFRRTFDFGPDCRVTLYEPRACTADDLRAAIDAALTRGEGE